MRYIRKFSKFNEAVGIEAKLSDDPTLKMSKDKLNSLTNQIRDYKAKKIFIDKAYLTSASDADLKIALEKIVGKTEVGPKEDRNPFLVEYLAIANFKRKIDKLQKEINDDKIKKDDFVQQTKQGAGSTEMTKKINEITQRTGTNVATIASLKKDIDTYQKKLDDKMNKIQKEMKDYVTKLSIETEK